MSSNQNTRSKSQNFEVADIETRSMEQALPPPRMAVPTLRRLSIQGAWIALDLICMAIAVAATTLLLERSPQGTAWIFLFSMAVVRVIAFVRIGMYRAVLRYSGVHTLLLATFGVSLGSLLVVAAVGFFYIGAQAGLGRGFWVMEGMLTLMMTGGARLAARTLLERHGSKIAGQRRAVLIYGAGSMGELVLRDLQRLPGYRIVGFLDDDPVNKNAVIHGKRVLGALEELAQVGEKHRVDVVVVAMQNPPPEKTRGLFKVAMGLGMQVLLAKGLGSAFEGGTSLGLRDLAMEDLLQRPSRSLDVKPVRQLLVGKRAFITGAGGSIGSELCRQVASMNVAALDILDHSEHALYEIHLELSERFPHIELRPHLCSLGERGAVFSALEKCKPDIVLHAAAYKHVPLVEANPFRGIGNNVLGLQNLIDACEAHGVGQLLLISTDKAVRPTNIMGASKRVCELLLQSRRGNGMSLCAVRFGNVLGSSGSVVPRFLDQIAKGGPVTVTHEEVTRYFMLIPEAVALVLQAAAKSSEEEAEIFILDMGEPIRISDLARQLIFMHGKTPDVDIQVKFTGLRPGEKLFEELLTDETERNTDIQDITVARLDSVDRKEINTLLTRLSQAMHDNDEAKLLSTLQELVPDWKPSQRYREASSSKVSAVQPASFSEFNSSTVTALKQ
ncbi:MAG: polysaccharide biosynthesis protein [Deltaproteobacteria bacterium]|nr:polysaccharide biosynthesis protein [Deltaproteobacteria bacterium]